MVGLRAEGPAGALAAGGALLDPGNGIGFEEGRHSDIAWARTRSAGGGGITAAACQHTTGGGRVVERLAVYLADPNRAAVVREVLTRTPIPVILLPRPA